MHAPRKVTTTTQPAELISVNQRNSPNEADALAFVDGRFCPVSEARVSIDDRGYQFADGVYEVIVAPNRRPFELEAHLNRLLRSANEIGIAIDPGDMGLGQMIAEGIERCPFNDVLVYVQITRGVACRNHVYDEALEPVVVATFRPKPVLPTESFTNGVAVRTAPDIRWARCDIKAISLLPNVMLKNEARRGGLFDVILLGPDAVVRETTCANVFIVTDGVLRTHPQDNHILWGITRKWILENAPKLGVSVRQERFLESELMAADEVFITSTTSEVLPVTRINSTAIGLGQPGETSVKLLDAIRTAMRSKS